jgi:site-specific DNA recombinase
MSPSPCAFQLVRLSRWFCKPSPDEIQHLAQEAATLAGELQHPLASHQRIALHAIVERITVSRERLRIELKPDPFGSTKTQEGGGSNDEPHDRSAAIIEIALRFVAKGQDMRLVIPPSDGIYQSVPLDKSLIKALARAVTWYDDLITGRADSMREIAAQENVSERYVAQLLRLAFLKPKLSKLA